MTGLDIPTVFLDRDGTLNPDSGYLSSVDQFRFYKHTLDVLSELANHGLQFVVVTNQSGIGRGIIPHTALEEIHNYIRHSFEKRGIPLLDIYYCPHKPDDGCECRKPKPGLFKHAADEHSICLETSYIIGDSFRDIEAGKQLGMTTVLVRTGDGRSSEKLLREKGITVDYIGNNLKDCTQFILKSESEK